LSKILIRIGIIIAGLAIIGGFLIVNLLIINNNTEPINVEIVTKRMNSCPDNFAWFIANISSKTQQNIPEITISTNITIETQCKLWSSTTPSVLEVLLYPNNTHTGQTIELKVKIGKTSDYAILNVLEWQESEQEQAYEKLAPFITYFSQNKPDFNINSTIPWEISCNDAGLLVVEHFLFRSENWELELSWHVMLPPYDWVKVYLRPRSQIKPIWGGMIESWNMSSNLIIETDPPEQVFRPQ
jgi:hypothetical protein